MYMILRIGPFIAAEWNFGGIPVWLHYVPGTVFRTNNEPFKAHMKNFTTLIVDLMKKEKLFFSQGGPIILSQIENEYGDMEWAYGDGAKPYAMWAANMALSQNIGVPWIMCQQYDAPDPVINTCNSFYCDQFTPNSVNKPKLWTENWPGWFQTFGDTNPHRPPEDIAFSVARFFQKGGSLQNYYMYHGGTNFGRTSGGPFITTSYDYDAPIDEYGLPRLPKWGHLKELHKAIKSSEHVLLYGKVTTISLGPLQEAHVYADSSGTCAAFIANMDDKTDKIVNFKNRSYNVPAWSVSILPDCKSVIFNTAKVSSQTSIIDMTIESLQVSVSGQEMGHMKWDVFTEKVGVWGKADFSTRGFVDHINTTKDLTDYLWYTTSFFVEENEDTLHNGSIPILAIESKGHAVQAFVNQELQGSGYGNGSKSSFKFKTPVHLKAGKNEIDLLSMTVGLQNGGPHYDSVGAGLTSVKIYGFRNGTVDLSPNIWNYKGEIYKGYLIHIGTSKIGLEGEHLTIYEADGLDNVKWMSTSNPPKNQPLTWYKAIVNPPSGTEPVALDMKYMGKGQAWLNGEPIGRYWPRKSSIHGECSSTCDYRGKFNPTKCRTGCGDPTQRWYHVPRSWFQPTGNVLVIFEEKGGDPTQISFSRRLVKGACSFIAEDYPSPRFDSLNISSNNDQDKPILHLNCPEGTLISTIEFASYGNPIGACGSYQRGSCHHPESVSVVERACLNKKECIVSLTKENFDNDPCPDVMKMFAVEVACG
ncbi:Beta-galactosidase 3 [Acorus calamus]|uniref:Beta-galactosidase n=1 Tax=Acorus calamus TaxID=4465 RepID=A0AAV9CGF6_ACOCL|nr:Beta-galactosidase 3 [Acorus calamus]